MHAVEIRKENILSGELNHLVTALQKYSGTFYKNYTNLNSNSSIKKSRIFSVHFIKAYMGSMGIAPLILNLNSR